MESKTKFCVVCGKKIPELSRRKVTCSDYCRKRKNAGFAPYMNYDVPPFGDLTEYQMAAQKRGMSYGQYVASLENAERKDKNNG